MLKSTVVLATVHPGAMYFPLAFNALLRASRGMENYKMTGSQPTVRIFREPIFERVMQYDSRYAAAFHFFLSFSQFWIFESQDCDIKICLRFDLILIIMQAHSNISVYDFISWYDLMLFYKKKEAYYKFVSAH